MGKANVAQEKLGKYGHRPDRMIDAEVEIDRLQGLITEAHGGLLRALDYRAATPEGLSIKADVRNCLERTGFTGDMGLQGGRKPTEEATRRDIEREINQRYLDTVRERTRNMFGSGPC